jgi:hypothetical protein
MHLFVYNNIFFSFCYDHRDPDFKPLQPPASTANKDEDKDKYAEQATYVSANNDLKGIRYTTLSPAHRLFSPALGGMLSQSRRASLLMLDH